MPTDKKISQLPSATNITNAFTVPVVNPSDTTQTYKTTRDLLTRGIVTTITVDTTLTNMHEIVYANTQLGDIEVTLPSAVGLEGKTFIIQKVHSSNNLVITPAGGQTINGAASLTFSLQYDYTYIKSNNANWLALATSTLSPAAVKLAYESNTDTNAFTDAEQAKLAGIQAGAQVNPSTTDALTEGATNLYMTSAEKTKLTGIQAGAQVNPTNTDSLTQGSANLYMSTEAKRLGSIASYNASSGNTFDPLPTRIHVFNMNANITNLTTLNNGAYHGQPLIIIFMQDGTGNRTCSFSANFTGGTDVGTPVLTTTASKEDVLGCMWNSVINKWMFVSFVRGY